MVYQQLLVKMLKQIMEQMYKYMKTMEIKRKNLYLRMLMKNSHQNLQQNQLIQVQVQNQVQNLVMIQIK